MRAKRHYTRKAEMRPVAEKLAFVKKQRAEDRLDLEHIEYIKALYEISLAINSALDLDAVLQILLTKIDRLFSYASGITVRLLNKETGSFDFIACRNIDAEDWLEQRGRDTGRRARAAIETRRPLIVRNIPEDPATRNRPFVIKHRLISLICLPLFVRDDPIGVLSLYTKEEHDFTPTEVEFLRAVADQAATAIGNALILQESRKRADSLQRLNQVAHLIASALDIEPGLTAIAEAAIDLMKVEMVNLWLLDEKSDLLRLAVDRKTEAIKNALTDRAPFREVRYGEEIAGAIWQTREPVFISDLKADNRGMGVGFIEQAGFHSYGGLPLIADDKVLGVLSCFSLTPRSYDTEERLLMALFADHAAMAIRNSRLYQSTRQYAADLENAIRVKDEFLSVMSHELRTPLNVTVGYVGMIQDEILGEISPGQRDACVKIKRHSEDLLNIIDDILTATTIETSGLSVSSQVVNLPELFDNLKISTTVPAGKNLSVIWAIPWRCHS
jgi:GAF domain-containing protein